MPPPAGRAQQAYSLLPDLSCNEVAEALLPEHDGFVADLDASLVEQALDNPEEERPLDILHHCQLADLRAGAEVAVTVRLGDANEGSWPSVRSGLILLPRPRRRRCYLNSPW